MLEKLKSILKYHMQMLTYYILGIQWKITNIDENPCLKNHGFLFTKIHENLCKSM